MKRGPKQRVPGDGPAPAEGADAIVQIKVWLSGDQPDGLAARSGPAGLTLRELLGVIQVAMGWEGIHLYQFRLRTARYGSSELSASSPDVTLVALRFRKGARFIYEYDLNIPWHHEIRIEDRLEPEAGKAYPACTGGGGACPPEDCAGPAVFMTRHDEMLSLDSLEDLGTMAEIIEEPQFLLNRQPVDAAAAFGRCAQAGALPGGFEDRLALGVVDPLADEDGGNGGGGALGGGHEPVCFIIFGEQTSGGRRPMSQNRPEPGMPDRLQLSTPVACGKLACRRSGTEVRHAREGPASDHRRRRHRRRRRGSRGIREANGAAGGPRPVDRRGQGADGGGPATDRQRPGRVMGGAASLLRGVRRPPAQQGQLPRHFHDALWRRDDSPAHDCIVARARTRTARRPCRRCAP